VNGQAQKSKSSGRLRRACAAAGFGLLILAAPQLATAQGWWPFGGDEEPRRPPVPREPVYRPEAQPAPYPQQQPQPQPSANWATKNPICLQLEQRLVQESQKGSQSRDQLPRIEAEIRAVDRDYNIGSTQLDRGCYESFLFTRTFRNTPKCKDLARQVEVAKRRLAELEAQRQDITGSSGRSYQDDIVRELARNNCGANYVDQARRRDGGFWQDEEAIGGNSWSPQGLNGVATYRTLCVRMCDGFYFPISFSTLPSHFPQDAEACSSRCAAPTELYYYPNPGGSVDQSVALSTRAPYKSLKVAFRYRKEYVNGCSCKEAEYKPADDAAAGQKTGALQTRGATAKTSAFPPAGVEANSAPPPADNGWAPQ
jgi:hypothetical protein